ncbi:hypothetical protein BBP40_001449 [Aspergillus hancockii]|nr:hypothetical protein BBP40_001449 [Aspergillus hancockii]
MPTALDPEDVLHRLRKLEEAVFDKSNCDVGRPQGTERPKARDARRIDFTPLSDHLSSATRDDASLDISYIARHLPPVAQARILFKHFALTLGPTLGVLHLPSTRELMEQTYQSILKGVQPEVANILLLLSIFAGSVLAWTPQLLEDLNTRPAEAKTAFTAYTHLAVLIMDYPESMEPSTTALAAMGTLAHVITNSDGFHLKIHIIRFQCLLMARAMQIHRLDSPKSRNERQYKGCNMIDVEVQRRAWWSMAATDWLNSFSGGPQEGVYTFQPKHMMVNYPSNVDDESITPTGVLHESALSQPSSMSAFIQRVKLASLCREVVDAMSSTWLETQEPDYDTILALDTKFLNFLDELPSFFQLDPTNVQKTRGICKERPYIPLQRITLHFSLHARLCRLHRPYHLEGITNPKYTYSHQVCIRSAQTVLELRHAMDEAGAQAGLKPARFWTVMQHVFLAALILATDVSFNPNAPDAETRKAKVLAAYSILERSKEESSILVAAIQKNMQILMSTLHKQSPQVPSSTSKRPTVVEKGIYVSPSETLSNNPGSREFNNPPIPYDRTDIVQSSIAHDLTLAGDGPHGNTTIMEAETVAENWDQLWLDFITVAPELDAPQWNVLLDDLDCALGPSI